MAKEVYLQGFGKGAFDGVAEVAVDLGASFENPTGEGHKDKGTRNPRDVRVKSHTVGDELTTAVLSASTYEFGTK